MNPSNAEFKLDDYFAYKKNSSPEMKAVMQLVSENRSLLKSNANLQSHLRAKEWTEKKNKNIKNEGNHYRVLPEVDYDGDNVNDIIVTKNGKVYSFNGYMPKDNDWPLRGAYLAKNQINDETGKYYGYTKKRFMNKQVDRENPIYIDFQDKYEYSDRTQQMYPAVKRYVNQAQKTKQSVYMAVVQSLAKNVWNAYKTGMAEKFPKHIKFADLSKLLYTKLVMEKVRANTPNFESYNKGSRATLLEDYWSDHVMPYYSKTLEEANILFEQLMNNEIRSDGTFTKPEEDDGDFLGDSQ